MDHSSQMNFLSNPPPPLLLCLSWWSWCPKLHFQIEKWLLTQFRSFPCFSCWNRSHFPCDTPSDMCHKIPLGMYCGCVKKMLVGEPHFVTHISFWSLLATWDLPLFTIPSSQIHATSCTNLAWNLAFSYTAFNTTQESHCPTLYLLCTQSLYHLCRFDMAGQTHS